MYLVYHKADETRPEFCPFVGGTLPKDLKLKLDRNYTNTTEHKIIKFDLAFIVTVKRLIIKRYLKPLNG